MGKFKPPKGKTKATQSRGALPCLVLLISGMLLMSTVLYLVMKG